MLAYTLYQEVAYRDVFFALTAGVLIIPLVTTQLLSAIFLLRRRGDSMSGGEAVLMAVLHVLQLGFIWRHVSVLREKDVLVKKVDLSELFVLRLTFTFAAGFPLMLMQLFLVLTEIQVDWQWVLYAALVASMLSTVWSVASFRRSHETSGPDAVVLSWPGSLFRLLWRAGEVVSRVISLTLFASLYKEWVFLVLGFHWVIMLVCVSVPQTVSGEWCGSTLFQRVVFCVVTSYAYVFCYVNFCTVKSAVWYTLYYVIMFLENGTLSIVWLTKSDSTDFSSRYLLVFVSALAFFAAMVCLAVYFKFFHVATEAPLAQSKAGVCVAKTGPGGCINCRLSLCTKHQHTGQQRPFSSGWMSHYHSAVTHGQYYKHAMHDSLLDSMSDLTSMTTAGSTNRRLQQKLSALDKELSESEGAGFHRSGRGGRLKCGCGREGDLEGGVSSCQTTSCAACHHRRLIKTSRSDLTDTTSVLTLEGGASQNLGYEGSDESQSNNIPAWLPAGESYIARQLLTGTPDSAGALSEKLRQQKQEKNLEHYRSLLKQEAQRWASDGYSTDHTVLEWSKLPVTVLGKNVWGIQDPESECCAYCCNEMSPGDSEVSSIFRAAHGAQLEACPGCNGGGGSCGGDVVYVEATSRVTPFLKTLQWLRLYLANCK
nr:hypothetical protein BaRGS_001690 [Batillaria attramentaria]